MRKKMQSTVAGKLRSMLMLTTGGVLFVAALLFIVLEIVSTRHHFIERVNTLSTFLSINIRTSLQFDDPIAGNEILQALRTEENLAAAYIYRADGSLFARYKANTETGSTQALAPEPSYQLRSTLFDNHQFNGRFFEYTQPIRVDDKLIGQAYFQYSLASVEKFLMVYLIVVVIIYLLSMLAVYSIAFKLQRRISGPIERILEAMQAITLKQHFGIRIRKGDDDEIGAIITGFNEMIEQIDHNARELEQQRQEIERHVFYDALTGLANRRLLIHKTEQEIVRSKRSHQKGALLYLDLDHFKTINDSLGHAVGDELLKTVSARISQVLREADTPARFGGDEFVILLPELGREEAKAGNNALSVADKIRDAISAPIKINESELHVTPSIGIVLFDAHHSDFEKLIVQADLAMYRAKDEGRNQAQFFLPYMQDNADHRQQIEERLRTAISNDQLQLYYQPQCNYKGDVVSAEALVRWQDKDHVWLNPATFIPIAEMTDLICMLGQWVLKTACEHVVLWEKQGKFFPVAVNISPREFQQQDFVEKVEAILLTTGVTPESLVFELTEGVLLSDIEGTIAKMNRLAELGIRFSLDDFGTGYSSLQYLKQLPLDTLKIDQSFVRDITTDPNDAAIVTTIIAMSKHMKMKVVAEGVEKEEELHFLTSNGCDYFQGYLLYKPLPFKKINSIVCNLTTMPPPAIKIASKPLWTTFD
ncbi:MAG: EAL domain-containing protein [Amphritea sp.]